MSVIMATIIGKREKEFEAIFGTACVPVTSTIPTWGMFHGGRRKAFVLDFKALPEEKRTALAQCFADDFGWSLQTAVAHLTAPGLLIPAADCVLSIFDPPRFP